MSDEPVNGVPHLPTRASVAVRDETPAEAYERAYPGVTARLEHNAAIIAANIVLTPTGQRISAVDVATVASEIACRIHLAVKSHKLKVE